MSQNKQNLDFLYRNEWPLWNYFLLLSTSSRSIVFFNIIVWHVCSNFYHNSYSLLFVPLPKLPILHYYYCISVSASATVTITNTTINTANTTTTTITTTIIANINSCRSLSSSSSKSNTKVKEVVVVIITVVVSFTSSRSDCGVMPAFTHPRKVLHCCKTSSIRAIHSCRRNGVSISQCLLLIL